jgi:WD40 repeat protein
VQPVGRFAPISACAIGPDGASIATGDRDGHVRVWTAAEGDLAGETSLGAPVGALDIAPDGSVLACGCDDGLVHFLGPLLIGHGSTVDLRPPLRLSGEPVAVAGLAYGPGGWLAVAGDDGVGRRLDVTLDAPSGPTMLGHEGPLGDIAASPDGSLLATAGWDGTARLWDATTGQAHGEPLAGHTDTVAVCTFSPDAALLATGSWDGTAVLWDVASGRPCRDALDAHTDWVTGCAFGADGSVLVTASRDDRIRVWDVASGACRLTLRTGYPLTCLAVLGTLVVVGADRHLLRFRLVASEVSSVHG